MQVQREHGDLLQARARHQLADGVFRPWIFTARQGRDGPHAGIFQATLTAGPLGQLGANTPIIDGQRAVGQFQFLAELENVGEARAHARADGQALVHQGGQRHFPALANAAEALGVGQTDIVEIDLVKARLTIGLLDRHDAHARRVHAQEEHGQALVLGHVRVGAGDQDAPLRIVRAAGPDLLAIDHPVVAIALSLGAQTCQIGTTSRFGEQLAPDVFACSQSGQQFALGLFWTPIHHGWAAHAVTDDERAGQGSVWPLFLVPDHALNRARTATAIFLGPVQAGPTGVIFLLLPSLGLLHWVKTAQLDPAEPGLFEMGQQVLGGVGVDPSAGFGAEGGFVGGVVEVHGFDVP